MEVVAIAKVWGGLQMAPTELLPTLYQDWGILGASCDQSPELLLIKMSQKKRRKPGLR